MHRHIAFICSSKTPDSVRAMRQIEATLHSASSGWSLLQQFPDMLVAQAGSRPRSSEAYPLSNESGVVLGVLFHRGNLGKASCPTTALEGSESELVLDSKCRHLVDRYWGKYVAFVRDTAANAYHVLRDPTAQMPCYHTTWSGIDIFFSHVEDYLRFVPTSLSVNWNFVIASLLAGDTLTRECGLNNVEDVLGGERLTICASVKSRTVLWNPADFCRAEEMDDQDAVANTLRSTVQGTISSLASCFNDILLSLSGGLDSSIVAGCLSQLKDRPNVTCLNHFLTLGPRDEEIFIPGVSKEILAKFRRVAGHADERRFARLVAERWGYPLVEHERRVQDIDLSRLMEAPISVAPNGFIGVMDLDDVESRTARETHADAFFTGQGGDTVFYATLQSLGAIDYVYRHGLNSHLAQQIANACALSKESVWRVLAKAFKYGVLRRQMPSVYDVLQRAHLLTDDFANRIGPSDIEHPWLTLAKDLPPGKRYHVLGLAHSALFYADMYGRERHAESVNPLTAQPVVENSLQVPTYTLLAGGISRGLARSAFSDILPAEIRRRTVKGSGSPFYQRLVRTNVGFMREMLLSGLLVRHGILDRKKVASYLVDGQQFLTVIAPQILHYVATEAWLRQWTSIQQKAAA